MDVEEESYYNITADRDEDDSLNDTYRWLHILFSVLQGSAAVLGLLTNLLLLVLHRAAPNLRSTTGILLLLQRAIADMCSSIALPLFIANRTYSSPALCSVSSILYHVGEVASLGLLMAFTLDGYRASLPNDHTLSDRRRSMYLTSTAAWLAAASTGVAAYFLTYSDSRYCFAGPFFQYLYTSDVMIGLLVLLVVPLVVVWTLVSVALPPRPALVGGEEGSLVEKCPNRRLLLGLASCFTVTHGLYHLNVLITRAYHSGHVVQYFFNVISSSLPFFTLVLNPVLVIVLTEELRHKITGWLPGRRSASVPLGDL